VGALHYRKEDVALGPLVAQQADAFAARCAERDLRLEVSLPADDVIVHADPARLCQLLHNLLDNAVRYTDPGGTVRVHLTLPEPTQARIEVADSAPGVAPELLARLFERFFRAEASRTRASGGSGLGLAIGRSIVEAHGGTIEATPSPLGGVCIGVNLPRAVGGMAA
jgi:signal transduction histidine kinase